MKAIKVSVVEFGDRTNYQMQWLDPITGRKRTKSTGVKRTGRKKELREAERVAALLEKELNEGDYRDPSKMTWEECRDRYEDEHLSGLADETFVKCQSVFKWVEEILDLNKLSELTTDRISHWQSRLREMGKSESTISGYSSHLRGMLNWAVKMKYLTLPVVIELPKRSKMGQTSKGRPLAGEEFDRMLSKVGEVVGASREAAVGRLLTGLWLSGLRISEAHQLSWDDKSCFCVDFSGEYPVFRIPAESHKSHRDQLLPMTPDFAALLDETPVQERTGLVFPVPYRHDSSKTLGCTELERLLSEIGKAAGVKVKVFPKSQKVKYASSHDLRRSFGHRWAKRVVPVILKEIMRHESITTTLEYYTELNAQETAKLLWGYRESKAKGNTFGNSRDFIRHPR